MRRKLAALLLAARSSAQINFVAFTSLLDGVEATHTLMLSDCSIMRASRRWRRVREIRLR